MFVLTNTMPRLHRAQESPPAWTQEAYRPPRSHSNFLLFWKGGGEGGMSLDKIFLSSLNMYQAKSGVKIFSLYWRGGGPRQKFFFRSEHVSSQIWCQNFFPLLGGGGKGVPQQNFFFQSEHVSSQIWCQKFFPFTEGGEGGGSPWQNFFFRSEHVSSQIWC